MPHEVGTQAVRLPADHEFLLSLYATTRRAELSMMGWSGTQADQFIRMQFDAQTRHYADAFPDATHAVVLVGEEPAGRLIVDRPDGEILIVDIALLPHFQGAGIGRELVRPLLEEADTRRLPVRLHVALDNDARAFWEHLGFVALGVDGVHVAMERTCAPVLPGSTSRTSDPFPVSAPRPRRARRRPDPRPPRRPT
jgi:ribosomal protein S18 acetylase RimI-like enzyme